MKRLSLSLFIFALATIFAIVFFTKDESLGENLTLENDDPHHVSLTKKWKPYDEIIVGDQIVDIMRTKTAVVILRKLVQYYDCESPNDPGTWSIISHNTAISEYWVVRLKDLKVDGPLKKLEFEEIINKNQIHLRRALTEGNYRANTPEFENLKLHCKNIRPMQ